MKIVIVDDNETILSCVVAMVMEMGGHEVIGRTAAYGALEGIRRLKPDLVITDYQMPD